VRLVEVMLETDEATSNQFRADLSTITREEVLVQKRENLNGMVDFIAILQAASPIVVAALPLIMERVRQKKVRRLRFGDFEVENPSEDQVRILWERYLAANPDRKA
jgi:hypothetical protein